ncbi:hypothetical protein BSKO_13515 [Bryopsis sp. KO-2023]|nr:hypothetical protein BSKO_13515 [Bryopsis sp. KO-2023]
MQSAGRALRSTGSGHLRAPGPSARVNLNGVRPVELQSGHSKFKVLQTTETQRDASEAGNAVPCPGQLLQRIRSDKGARPGAAGGRKAAVVWFTSDLRLHDNEALLQANSESSSILPVFCVDPRAFKKSPGGFRRIDKYHAKFILDSVESLRVALRDVGSDLVVRFGNPEEIVPELAKKAGASAVYCQEAFSTEERRIEEMMSANIAEEGVKLKKFSGKTLLNQKDLPFRLKDLPRTFAKFQDMVAKIKIEPPKESPSDIKGLPLGSVEAGDIPTLQALGFDKEEISSMSKCRPGSLLKGGEPEALKKLREQKSKPGKSSNVNFSSASKLSPWLAEGCLSPRRVYNEFCLTSKKCSLGASSLYELLWSDFFQFLESNRGSKQPVKKSPQLA